MKAFQYRIENILLDSSEVSDSSLSTASALVRIALTGLINFLSKNQKDSDLMELSGRNLCLSFAHIYVGALLIEQAFSSQNKMDALVAQQWTITRLR